MSEQNTPEITDEMVKAVFFNEEGNRRSDKDITEMLHGAFRTAAAIAKFSTLLTQLVIDVEEAEELLRPSQIGFATFASPEESEPNQTGTLLGLAVALKGYLAELDISPKIESSETMTKDESSRVFHALH